MKPLAFRPPAVPLVAVDPYFSIWSFGDALNDSPTVHWTGKPQRLGAFLRLDGKAFRLIGSSPEHLPALAQKSVAVHPTRTVYVFQDAGIRLTLTFLTPALPDDLLRLSWPVTYVDFSLDVVDGKRHEAGIYFEMSAELCADHPSDSVNVTRPEVQGLKVMGFGTRGQRVLEKSGDDRRIDWGWAYLAIPDGEFERTSVSLHHSTRDLFLTGKAWPSADSLDFPASIDSQSPSLACATSLTLRPKQNVSRHLILAYDDLFSIEYHQRKLRPYWRAQGMTASSLLLSAANDYQELRERCAEFDETLESDLEKAGGAEYAALCCLAFRQCLAAHKLCQDFDGTLLYFSKENFSNGCIATVDVTYPSAPFFLLFCPELLRAQLVPILDYAVSARWKFPFAPHDLGCYPHANGQVYGGGETSEKDQMPVEECGNMLILVAALGKRTGDWADARRYAGVLKRWAEYLAKHGPDPAEQLCTDDFAGHLARNANLALKAIVGLRCYAEICTGIDDKPGAAKYQALSKRLLAGWEKNAGAGDHYALAFGQPETWSQKYNLVWDKILDLGLIPKRLIDREISFYRAVQDPYGLPLDSRKHYSKLDWIVWTATLVDDEAIFQEFVVPLFRWANETPSRVPLTDWFWTDSGRQVQFQARSVVGGLFIKLLADSKLNKKWLRSATPALRLSGRKSFK